MRWLRTLARILGWLLTPFVAWAASFMGSWFAAAVTPNLAHGRTRLLLLLMAGGVTAVIATIFWLRLLRRSPELQEALAVHPDGTPIAADDEES